MELSKIINHTKTAEPEVLPIIKPSPSKPKPKRLPEEWEVNKPKIAPSPKG